MAKECRCKTSKEFADFMLREYSLLAILSSKGTSAARVSVREHMIACTMVCNFSFKIGICVIGVPLHMFMCRFSLEDNSIVLASIYELSNKATGILEDGRLQSYKEWGLCCICYKKADKYCPCCSTLYCSRRCQMLDFHIHQKQCKSNHDLSCIVSNKKK